MISPREYGRSLRREDLPDAIRRAFPLSPNSSDKPSGQGLTAELLMPMLAGVLNDVREIRDALTYTEVRLVGTSMLIVYESAWDRARTALDRMKADSVEDCTDEDRDSIGLVDDAEADQANDEEYEGDSDDDEVDEAPPYVVKLIDFAHAKLVPGQGPDEGVLFGLDTVISLLLGRIEEIKQPS